MSDPDWLTSMATEAAAVLEYRRVVLRKIAGPTDHTLAAILIASRVRPELDLFHGRPEST